jgi:hypothetical protein
MPFAMDPPAAPVVVSGLVGDADQVDFAAKDHTTHGISR